MYVAHYAFYVACILHGCDMSTGILYEYMDMEYTQTDGHQPTASSTELIHSVTQ